MLTKTRIYLFYFCVAVLLCVFAFPLAAEKAKNPHERQEVNLTWKPVPGAIRYVVEIRSWWGKQILRKASWNNRIKVRLTEGRYRMQVTGRNKFKKKHGISNWKTIVVKPFPAPEIDTVSPDEIKSDQGKVTINLEGENFLPGMSVYIINAGKKQKIPRLLSRSSKKATFILDPGALSPGDYDLQVQNPSGKEDTETKSITVKEVKTPADVIVAEKINEEKPAPEKRLPQAERISPRRVYLDSGIVTLTIKGKNLDKASEVRMYSASSNVLVRVVEREKNSLSFSINSDILKVGNYRVFTGPRSSPGENDLAVTVADPSKGLAALGGLNIALGYTFSVPLPQWSRVYHFSYAGVFLYGGYDFSGFGLPRWLSFLQYFGMEYQFSWNRYESYKMLNRVPSILDTFANEMGLYAFVPLKKRLRLYFHLRGGLTGSILDTEYATGEIKVHSYDYSWQAGTALRYTWRHFYFIEFGTYFQWLHFTDEPMLNLNAAIMFGVRL